MAEILTHTNVGDTVWWVHCSGKVYKGTVQAITVCEYSGALYCHIFSPSFRRNPYPTVHYSEVFLSRNEANEFSDLMQANEDDVFPRCMGCHYSLKIRGMHDGEGQP